MRKQMHRFGLFVLGAIGAVAVVGCGGGGSGTPPPPPPAVPSISNINNSTTPTSPVSLAIGINGTGFQAAPGQVIFTQGSISSTVTPAVGGWSNTSIVAVVPSGNGTTNFTVPGTVTVTIKTSGGTSNGVTLNLVQTSNFKANNVTWIPATPLPVPLTGLRAVAVQSSNTAAFAIVAGGFNGTANVSTVYTNTLAQDGTLGTTWTASANPLPATLAHFGMVEANAQNSLVPANSHFIYVIGGQANSSDTPGGTNAVYMTSVDQTTGTVGTWKTLTTTLPDSLVGPAVTIYNGYIYVAGGLSPQQTPVTDVFSAPINSDGTLGSWTKSTNALPLAISFATAFGFGGNLYVLNGDPNGSSDPNQSATVGLQDVRVASANNGAVGNWTLTNTTIKKRKKHNTWVAFGQVIDAEGIYDGGPGSRELEASSINPDGSLAAWNGISANVNQINANVFNAASFVSPLLSSAGNPRFLLLGGETFSAAPGVPTALVYVNTAP
jgi:N-acetylneuraminic acid mutarotase